jgi:hypothetical protein
MKKVIEAILSCVDKHQKETIYSALFLSIFSGILYTFFHTTEYGYDAEINDNLCFSIFPIIMVILTSRLHKINSDKLDKRIVTYFYLLLFITFLAEVCVGLYCVLVKDISIIAVAVIYIPLLIALVLLLYHTRDFYKKYADIMGLNIKSYVILFINSFKKK